MEQETIRIAGSMDDLPAEIIATLCDRLGWIFDGADYHKFQELEIEFPKSDRPLFEGLMGIDWSGSIDWVEKG